MNVLINLAAMKSGGGQNVGLNFLHAIRMRQISDIEFIFMVSKKSEAEKNLKDSNKFKYFTVPANPVIRIIYEALLGRFLLRQFNIDIVYSYFGFAFFIGRVPQVSGCAVSNLFFPEIDFWHGCKGLAKIKRILIDKYRLYGIKRATALVFENIIMEEQGRTLFGLKRTKTIFPSIHVLDSSDQYFLPERKYSNMKRGLFLCGWNLNKNVLIIPEIAAALRQIDQRFEFVITVSKDKSKLCRRFIELSKKYNVCDMIIISGSAKKEQLASLYSQIDFVFLLSKLESFSNNIIEAWTFGKPLVIANEPWANALCNDSVEYVDRDSPMEIAEKIKMLIANPSKVEILIKRGSLLLQNFPSMDSRINQEIQFLRDVYEEN